MQCRRKIRNMRGQKVIKGLWKVKVLLKSGVGETVCRMGFMPNFLGIKMQHRYKSLNYFLSNFDSFLSLLDPDSNRCMKIAKTTIKMIKYSSNPKLNLCVTGQLGVDKGTY